MNYNIITTNIKNRFITDADVFDNSINFFPYLENLINKKKWKKSDIKSLILLIESGFGPALNNFFYYYDISEWNELGFPKPDNKIILSELSKSSSFYSLSSSSLDTN